MQLYFIAMGRGVAHNAEHNSTMPSGSASLLKACTAALDLQETYLSTLVYQLPLLQGLPQCTFTITSPPGSVMEQRPRFSPFSTLMSLSTSQAHHIIYKFPDCPWSPHPHQDAS